MVSVTVVSGLTECSIMFNDKDVLYVSGWGQLLTNKSLPHEHTVWVSFSVRSKTSSATESKMVITSLFSVWCFFLKLQLCKHSLPASFCQTFSGNIKTKVCCNIMNTNPISYIFLTLS